MRIAILLALLVVAAAPAQKIRVKPSPGTLACGKGVQWQDTLDKAFEAARAAGRPVFWYVPTVRDSRMDRRPEIDHYMMAGPFSSPLVETLLNRKFIPVKAVARGRAQETYGLRHGLFIEPGFLVIAPDGNEILRLDKLTTLNAEWFAWQIRRALKLRPDLAADSAAVAAARKSNDALTLARALLEEGDTTGAAAAIPKVKADDPPEIRYLRGRIAVAQRDVDAALENLQRARRGKSRDRLLAEAELGILMLRRDRPKDAARFFTHAASADSPRRDESRFFLGVCLHLQGDHDGAAVIWKKLAASKKSNRWARKASAESQRLGPFSRCFERFDWIPREAFLEQADGTRWPREREHLSFLIKRSVRLLLRTQKKNGVWDDSNYDFGGTDSLPNVYVAGTALAARALLEYPEVAGDEGNNAVRAAFDYVCDPKNLAWDDKDEIVWAHAYRLYFLEKLISDGHPLAGKAKTKAKEIVNSLSRDQLDNGSWRHEYANPFATATVVMCLAHIGGARVPIGKQMMKNAGKALLLCRGDDGTFTYGMPGRRQRGRRTRVESSAGRMPICEMALLLAQRSDQKKLVKAIATSFEHHHHLERIRKYDDHADRFGNGGFFFWHDVLGRAEAIALVQDAKARRRFTEKEMKLILGIPEIDGGFVDSHELGKTYGTAMGLLSIKLLMRQKP